MPADARAQLAATVTVEQAAERAWDVVVAGAGPAGAVAARQLALRGANVLLADRASFPRWKVCGCCVNGAALDALDSLGLGEMARGLGGRRLTRMRFAVGTTETTLPLHAGVAVSREAFDSALIVEAIGAGSAFLPGTEAVLLPGAVSYTHLRAHET